MQISAVMWMSRRGDQFLRAANEKGTCIFCGSHKCVVP